MIKTDTELIITRIERFYNRLKKYFISDYILFDTTFSCSKEPVTFNNRLKGKFNSIKEGENWGSAWDNAWFHLQADIPKSWKGEKIVAYLDFSGEGLVFSPEGIALQGVTNASIFDPNFARTLVPLFDRCKGSEKVELWVEATASSLFGVKTDPDPSEDSPTKYGSYDAKLESARLAVFNEDIWHLWLDLRVLRGLIKHLPEKSVQRARIVRSVNNAINAYGDDPANVNKSRGILKQELRKPASASSLSVTAVGHAHIDTAWLWQVHETIRKCARTFSTQLALIEKYPEYVFGASQPQQYVFMKEHYPEIYARIKNAVKKGQWELQGGMWVEADCNLISGESMIRQILHGKNYFMDEFGVDVDNLWLPDVFGYSASMPQILKKSGINYFLTQKISWNQTNEFPHHTFLWRGIDGSEILTHFPPENNYCSELDIEFLVPAQERFKEKDFIDEFLSLYGVGDGGGGPKEGHIQLGKRIANLEGAPKVKFGTAGQFFKRMKKYEDKLETWVGELYLEAHRGTLTTHADVKKANRVLENKLKQIEFLYSCLPVEKYPAAKLDYIWKKVLINQFHDIIPGSSIAKVYEDTRREHKEALADCETLFSVAAKEMFDKDNSSLVFANVLHYPFLGTVVLPQRWKEFGVIDENGKPVPVQKEDNHLVVSINIEPYSFLTLYKIAKKVPAAKPNTSLILENEFVRYEFGKNGTLINAWDKIEKRSILAPGKMGNVFSLYEDRALNWDAWDVEIFYENSKLETARIDQVNNLFSGTVRQGIQFNLKIGHSTILQKVYLAHNSRRLDFETTVEWFEKHKMLRVEFPVNVYSETASFDIQYGYLKRNTHRNTSWDKAKFEVAAQRYVDLSDNEYGVAILNDCKYGHKILDNVLDLNLLRSTNYPDPDADQGKHQFTYSLYPHAGDLIRSKVMSEAAQLNQGLLVFDGYKTDRKTFPWRLEGNGLALETVKKSEKENCYILRVVETHGCNSAGKLMINKPVSKLVETDLMEWENGNVILCDNSVEISLKPFEIKTFKLIS